MELKEFTIESVGDIFEFFHYLMDDLHVNFHPDDSFECYVNTEDGSPSFTQAESDHLNKIMGDCFDYCEKHDINIYELSIEVARKYINPPC